jgi:hypothetical protein
MNPLRDYVEHWFAHTALRTGRPNWLKLTEQWITDVAGARPGFAAELRQVAREALSSSERDLVHRGLAALAVVGTKEDLSAIESLLTNPDSYISGAASTARFEIVHRAA